MQTIQTSQLQRVEEPGNGVLEIFDLPTDAEFLNRLLEDLFANHWDKIIFGTLIQGAVFEIKAPNAPVKIGYLDGYLTIDFGAWHLHICTGENKGTSKRSTPPELAQIRRTSRAEIYRRLNPDDSTCPAVAATLPASWQTPAPLICERMMKRPAAFRWILKQSSSAQLTPTSGSILAPGPAGRRQPPPMGVIRNFAPIKPAPCITTTPGSTKTAAMITGKAALPTPTSCWLTWSRFSIQSCCPIMNSSTIENWTKIGRPA